MDEFPEIFGMVRRWTEPAGPADLEVGLSGSW